MIRRPELLAEAQIKMKTILSKNLPKVKTEKINIPWNEIKSVPKADRKNFRKEYALRMDPHQHKNFER